MKETQVKKKSSFLTLHSFDEVVAFIIPLVKKKVLEAYVFGSFSQNQHHADSDLDLILIMETKEIFIERPLQFLELKNLPFEIDILVYTPAEFEKLKLENSAGFWSSAKKQLKKII